MDRTIAGLIGAVGAFVAATPGQAAPLPPAADTVLHAASYAELLRPVPNAAATLRAIDEAGQDQGQVELVQLGPIVRALVPHRHHHHHHRYYRRRHHHHHHHHHHRSPFR